MKNILLLLFSLIISMESGAQETVVRTFKDTRIINTHSVETLPKRKLDVRIAHRFGDLAGDNGGFQTFYGLENVADVAIGVEYGAGDRLTIGLYRSKGAGSMPDGTPGLRQLVNGLAKYRLLYQAAEGGPPVSVTLMGMTTMSAAQKIDNPDAIRNFATFSHRFAYVGQALIARKYSDALSIQLIPSYTYRNITPFGDPNGLFSLGAGARIQLTKVFGLVADATFPFSSNRGAGSGFHPALGFGLEIDTGGHVFQVNITNATGLMETDYIPYTTSSWADGEFRLGFTISRLFNL
jgi:hypothetical protein